MEYSVFTPKPGFQYFDDYDDDEEEIRYGALPVDGESAPSDGPPTTGEEYLRRVRWESNQCPGIVVSNIDPSNFAEHQSNNYFRILEPIVAPPNGFAPPKIWEQQFLEDFHELVEKHMEYIYSQRENIPPPPLELPPIKEEGQWHRFLLWKERY